MDATITNTIVSLGHVRQGDEFRHAFAVATVHDFLNLIQRGDLSTPWRSCLGSWRRLVDISRA